MRSSHSPDGVALPWLWPLTVLLTTVLLSVFLLEHAHAAGRWLRADGTWEAVPCPSAELQSDEASAVRLPAGCEVAWPRIGYGVAADLRIRDELVNLRARDARLQLELRASRGAADEIIERLSARASEMQKRLDAERDAELRVTDERDQARAERDVARAEVRSYAALFGVGGLILGGFVGLLAGVAVAN